MTHGIYTDLTNNKDITMNTEIAVIEALKPLDVYGATTLADAIIEKVRQEASKVGKDVSTQEGRDAIRSMAHKIARSKTALDRMGKDLTEDWMKKKKAVDAERKRIWQAMEGLQNEVRKPLTDFENAEKQRIREREERIALINSLSSFDIPSPEQGQIKERISSLEGVIDFDWQEFKGRAESAIAGTKEKLESMLAERIKYDAEQEELTRLRKEAEERERKERDERLQREAAERAKAEAEAKHKKEIERLRKEEEERREAKERAARLEREAAENKRREEEEAVARRQADREHRAMIEEEVANTLGSFCKEGKVYKLIRAISDGAIPHLRIEY